MKSKMYVAAAILSVLAASCNTKQKVKTSSRFHIYPLSSSATYLLKAPSFVVALHFTETGIGQASLKPALAASLSRALLQTANKESH